MQLTVELLDTDEENSDEPMEAEVRNRDTHLKSAHRPTVFQQTQESNFLIPKTQYKSKVHMRLLFLLFSQASEDFKWSLCDG